MRVGVVGDLHVPFTHPCYMDFCRDMFKEWKVDHVHFVGDIVDNHAISRYEANPDGLSAEDEYQAALKEVQRWHKAFPKATVCIGNHDDRHYRTAKAAGISTKFLKQYHKLWGTPKWTWDTSFVMEGVYYEHGSTSGKNAALNAAVNRRRSLVMGHTHSFAGVQWHTNDESRIFALNAGCGIDIDAYAFEYGKNMMPRPTLGCGIVIDGLYAFFEPLPCGRGEPYDRHL